MADENLEQRVNTPPQDKQEEKKPVSTLESVLGEIGDLFNLGVGIAAPAAGYALTGNAGVLAASTAFVAGTKGKKDSKTIRNESLSGAVFGTVAHYATLPLTYLTNLGKAAYMAVFPFFGNAAYMAGDHLVKNRSPSGLYKKFKESYWPNVKKSLYSTAPIMVASALLLPQQFMVGAIALANYIYRRFVIKPDKVEEYEDKTPYPVATLDVLTRLVKNPVKGFYESIGAIARGIRDTFYKVASKPVAPAPAPVIAPQPA